MVVQYNKLVRDKIPQIIREQGKTCTIRVLDEMEYICLLEKKLQEELDEYLESRSTEELADLLEVMMAVAKVSGNDWEVIEQLRVQKRQARGGFDDRIALLEVSQSAESCTR